MGVTALQTLEHDGLVWVWPGARPPLELPPSDLAVPNGYQLHAEIMVEVR